MMLAEKLLAQHAQFASSFNFGPGDEDAWTVERIVTKLVRMWGDGASWVRDSAPSVHEGHVLRLDASKARVEMGWQPRLKIEAALEWTMAWYRAWNEGEDMTEFTAKQMLDFENCATVKLNRETERSRIYLSIARAVMKPIGQFSFSWQAP